MSEESYTAEEAPALTAEVLRQTMEAVASRPRLPSSPPSISAAQAEKIRQVLGKGEDEALSVEDLTEYTWRTRFEN